VLLDCSTVLAILSGNIAEPAITLKSAVLLLAEVAIALTPDWILLYRATSDPCVWLAELRRKALWA
jgi:hypothetical protein